MKYRLNEKATVFSTPDSTSPIVAELQAGDYIHIGETLAQGERRWDLIRIPDGRSGYIPATTKGERVDADQTPAVTTRTPADRIVLSVLCVLVTGAMAAYTTIQRNDKEFQAHPLACLLGSITPAVMVGVALYWWIGWRAKCKKENERDKTQ